MKAQLLFLGLIFTPTTFANAQRFETIILSRPFQTNEILLKKTETARLETFIDGSGASAAVSIIKDSETFVFRPGNMNGFIQGGGLNTAHFNFITIGPATIRIVTEESPRTQDYSKGLITFKITQESFPPDKTIIIPEGQQAEISLEKSTNLIHWEHAESGIYNNTNGGPHLFFRLRAQRVE